MVLAVTDLASRLHHPLPSLTPAPKTLGDIAGLRAAGVRAGIKASGNPDVALLVADAPIDVAAVFTQNKFAAAPVLVCREHLAKTGGRARAIVVNSGNANACTGDEGLQNARTMCADVAALVGCPVEEVLVASTGVIGVPLPMEKVRAGIRAAFEALAAGPEAGRAFLAAIQTTDAYPKEAATLGDGWSVAGVCKGAGMIAPNMATMLAFVATDAPVDPGALTPLLRRVATGSFNAVHVDSHPSTNDSLFLLATRRGPQAPAFDSALEATCKRLAWLIARDGEGATKVTTIRVTGAASDEAAQAIARRVAESALVRTALFGNDPNWGRFVSQVGNARDCGSVAGLVCKLQGITVFEKDAPTAFDRAAASRAMAAEDVLLELHLTEGAGSGVVLTSDLGYRYVEVNAEYTT
jgi:glutamate N-acetyltransferase/amino-acid N-acetyltransferase